MNRPYPDWDPEVDDVFVCTAVRTVARDVATVVLAPRRASTITFNAGQYVTVEFLIDGQPVHRCYTISSPPSRPERLAITVKRIPAGTVSPWLHDGGLGIGSTVRLGAPQGEFTLERHPAPAYLFLTAGVGITPALSVLREMHDLGTDLDVVLLHSHRNAADVPYRHELEWIESSLPRARLHLLASEQGRRLDADLLARLVADAAEREVFICGPDGYRAAARDAARAQGAIDSRIHEEVFDIAARALPPPTAERDARASGSYHIEFADHGALVDCSADTTVLDAAVAAGLAVPFSCTQGLCGTCKSTLVAGEVDMHHAGGIRPREIAAGKILLCCSRPRSNLVITR